MKCEVDGERARDASWRWIACLFCLSVSLEGAMVTNLACEGLVNPVGMDAKTPRLSWQVISGKRADRQTAYQILVASDMSTLSAGRGDAWDSGKQRGDQSIHVPYGGKPLAPLTRYRWKVRVWDAEGQASDWSRPAQWLTGLAARDWEADWIGAGDTQRLAPEAGWLQEQSSPLFRRSFEVKRPVESAVLCVSGLGYYECRLNGGRVGDRVLDPALTRYDKRVLYSTYDVTARVQQGENVLGAMLGNGWYNLHTRAVWGFNKAPWRDRPKLIAQLHLRYRDGGKEIIRTDGSWKVTTGPLVRDGIRHGEEYDARRELPGWDGPGYDDRAWSPAKKVKPPGGSMHAQMLPPCRVTATLRPVRVSTPRPGINVVDMGQNFAGWVQLTVRGAAGTRVTLRYGERLADDGTLDQKRLSNLVESGPFQTDVYILKGGGVDETWSARFAYHGFRYVQVEGYPGRLTAERIQGCVVHTDFKAAGTFACSSDQLNRTQSQVLWSYRSNFLGIPTDCPHREKNAWLGSAQLAAEQAMFNFHNAAGYRKWLQDLRDEQRADGALPAIVPTGGWGYQWGSGPAAGSASVVVPWLLYVYCGDRQVLEDCYGMMKGYVDYLSSRADKGIVDFGKEDASAPRTRTPRTLTSTAYYYADALTLARTAQVLGKDKDAAAYGALARSVRQAFRRRFIGDGGRVQPETLTALACVLDHGLAESSERRRLADRLADLLIHGRWQMDAGVLGSRSLLRALSDNGRHRTAYWAATQPRMPGYGYWVEQGATTLWEHWSGKGSRNHIMFGDISAWFYRSLAGIRPDPSQPGFRHVVIRPQPVPELSWARAEHESPYGLVHSSWRRRDRDVLVQVKVPVNARATVYLPLLGGGEIMESGVKAEQAAGVTPGKREAGMAVYGLASGHYRFIIPLPIVPAE